MVCLYCLPPVLYSHLKWNYSNRIKIKLSSKIYSILSPRINDNALSANFLSSSLVIFPLWTVRTSFIKWSACILWSACTKQSPCHSPWVTAKYRFDWKVLFHNKDFALGLVFKLLLFGTWKWSMGKQFPHNLSSFLNKNSRNCSIEYQFLLDKQTHQCLGLIFFISKLS